jgi:uncharacterized RDD family membrane protein YckC
MASTGDVRFSPPSAPVADVVTTTSEVVLASRWQRLGVYVFDGFLVALVFGLLGFAAGINPFTLGARTGGTYRLMGVLGWFLVFLLLHGYLLVTSGQTIGKRLFGMRVVRPDGGKVTAFRILVLRYGVGWTLNIVPLLAALYGLLDCVLIFRASRRCLHDDIADTIVIRV